MASVSKRDYLPLPWLVQWREPASKKQRWKSFLTKREADAFRDRISLDLREGHYVNPTSVPFAKYAVDWLSRRKSVRSSNTVVQYEWAVRRYLVPGFGAVPLQRLHAERIERWQAVLLERRELSPRSVQIIRGVLGQILKDARLKGRLHADPLERVATFQIPKREGRFLTLEQVGELCRLVGVKVATLFLMMGLCGLRIGEVTAVGLDDCDLRHGRLHIRRQLMWRRRSDCRVGEPRWAFVEPKSAAGKRVVEIPAAFIPFLKRYMEEVALMANPHGLLFMNRLGGPLEGRNVHRRHFKVALCKMGLSGIRPHDFRRTFTALHVEAGTHPKLVQARLGHSDIRLTMDLYGKLAGDIALGEGEATRFNTLAARMIDGSARVGGEGGNENRPSAARIKHPLNMTHEKSAKKNEGNCKEMPANPL